MVSCEQCGSIRIARAHPSRADRLVAILTSHRPFVCRRCGWRARRTWTNADLKSLEEHLAGDGEPDPGLAVLDASPGYNLGAKQRAAVESDDFRLEDLRFTDDQPPSSTPTDDVEEDGVDRGNTERGLNRPRFRQRRRITRRRRIAGTVAISALAMFIIAIASLTSNCRGE